MSHSTALQLPQHYKSGSRHRFDDDTFHKQSNGKLTIKIVVSYPRKNILSKAYSTLNLWKEEIFEHILWIAAG